MKRLLFILLLVGIASAAFATHNKAGEITYRHISGLTYEVTITTYTDSGANADRNQLEVFWGDMSSDSLSRQNGPFNVDGFHDGELLIGYRTKKNIYTGVHTYPGSATYVISMQDLNRVDAVLNMPNSVNIPFYIETVLVTNGAINPENSSPVLNNPAVDRACVNKLFVHNPWAIDPDGDSLSYELHSCEWMHDSVPPGYTIPSGVSVNPVTGDFIWNTPTTIGWFSFAFRVVEWRNGFKIGYVTRDMLVIVQACPDENPPVIQPPADLCVTAGDSANFTIRASDPDLTVNGQPRDSITLSSNGSTYSLPNASTFVQTISQKGYAEGVFKWKTSCAEVRKQPYAVYFKAEDSYPDHLTDYKTVNITVVGPAPQNPTANPSGTSIFLTWEPSLCSQAIGYKIYRRNGIYSGTISCPCTTGAPDGSGFSEIAQVEGLNNTAYTDDNGGEGLIHGNDYCYLIVAVYPDGAMSCASTQVCAELKKDLPVITNVDIQVTDPTNGKIYIAWSPPTEIDAVLNPPPYKIKLMRSDNMGLTYIPVTEISDVFNDTTFVDTHNTANGQLMYKAMLFNSTASEPEHLLGTSRSASSVLLSITPTDNRLELTWSELVPWRNTSYDVFRLNASTSLYDSLGRTNNPAFSDTGLVNGAEYCYYVRSNGAYSASGFVNPIENRSQQACAKPIDNVAPCAPLLHVQNNCEAYQNTLTWNNPNLSCADDVMSYAIYYSPILTGTPLQIATINSAEDTVFVHDKLLSTSAGCYLITALDSAGNESVKSDPVCVDNCPEYMLPNVFTPDGNGFNDFLKPFPYRYVESIDLHIYNRWGMEVFHTEDPEINWDGKNASSKKECSEGVYFYTCKVNTIRLEGIVPVQLRGFLHLISNQDNGPVK